MRVVHGLESARLSSVVLTIGNFDGVHRGHQAILAAGRRRADAASTRLVVATFDPHPAAVLRRDPVPPTLTPLDEKVRCLEQAGADVLVVVRSRAELFGITAGRFITEVILPHFSPLAVVEGASFRFGRHRQGNVDTLRSAGRTHGFEVEVVEPVRVALGGHPETAISSSLVRHLLSSGTVDQAAVCLGRPYALFGRVTHGAGRGRSLGFPTANLTVARQLIPADAVYAGRAYCKGRYFAAAASIGRNPTFDDTDVAVEAHLLDFTGDLLDQQIRLELIERLRGQQKFDSPQALHDQIARDVARVREVVASDLPNR